MNQAVCNDRRMYLWHGNAAWSMDLEGAEARCMDTCGEIKTQINQIHYLFAHFLKEVKV
jgi:hypothetical protein